MKKAYYYLFYTLYKFSESAPSKWLSDWKAGIVIIALELFLIASVVNYYVFFIDRTVSLDQISNWAIFICVLAVTIPNYFAFIHSDIWKDYVKEYDQLSKFKNKRGKLLVIVIVLFIIINFIFSFYLYYQI